MGTFSLVVMIVVVIGVVMLILLVERRRAEAMERDLRPTKRPSEPPRAWDRDE